MEIRPTNGAENTLRNKITGSTTINHRIRVEFKLSLEEYVLLDFIFNWNKKSNEAIRFKDYYVATGFINNDIIELFKVLKEKKLLIKDLNKNRVDVAPEWTALFSTDGSIERLWKIHPKGNKKQASLKLGRVLKKISIDELCSKLTHYVKWCDATNTFKKDLSTWLNPELEHWNNDLKGTQKQLIPDASTGYLRVSLWANKKRTRFLIHRLVAMAFIQNSENKPFVNHINGIKHDNRVDNLEWCTYSENLIHAYRTLKRNPPNHKFTQTQIDTIRMLHANNTTQKDIKHLFGCSHSTISEIINNKRYIKH